jgi:hypothetical protein
MLRRRHSGPFIHARGKVWSVVLPMEEGNSPLSPLDSTMNASAHIESIGTRLERRAATLSSSRGLFRSR